MPRSGFFASAAAPRAAGFNEAGAIMPRSGQTTRNPIAREFKASMRPGQSCPGVDSGKRAGFAAYTGFNEAGAIMPRSGRRSSP